MADRRIAAFDFDCTVTRRDTMVPFLLRVGGPLSTVRGVAGAGLGWVTGGRERNARRAKAKRAYLRAVFAGLAIADLEDRGRRYAETLPELYRPESLERIEWHRSEGHELVLVTASLRLYAGPAGEALGFDHVIAVDLEADAAGRATGDIAGTNVRGPEKARRLTEYLGEPPAEMWAYGDSDGDTQLLAMADHPTWVGRRANR